MFSLLQPWALLGLPLLALPVLAHLIHRRRAHPWHFPAIRFIRPSPLPRQGRRQMRDIPLLIARLLILLLLILAFTLPVWTSDSDSAASGEFTRTIVLLDRSASMTGWNAWPEAREKAREALSGAGAAGLITFAASVGIDLPPARDPATARERLASLEPSFEAGAPDLAFRALESHLTPGTTGEIRVISDFQESDWLDVNWPRLPAGWSYRPIPVGQRERRGNQVLLAPIRIPDAKDPSATQLAVPVRNDSPGTVALRVEIADEAGVPVGGTLLEIPPQETATALIPVPPNSLTGAGQVRLSGHEDPMPLDNERWFWSGNAPPRRVPIVTAPTLLPSGDGSSESFFLGEALGISLPRDTLRFQPQGIEVSQLGATSLRDAPFVMVTAAAAAHPAMRWDLLAEYLWNGGRALVSLDENAARTLSRMREAGISEARFAGIAGRVDAQASVNRIGEVRTDRFAEGVFDPTSLREFYRTRIGRHVRVSLPENAEVLIGTESGDPLLWREGSVGGEIVLSALPFALAWSDLPLRPVFLPLVREIAAGPAEHQPVVRLAVGQSLPDELRRQALARDLELPALNRPTSFELAGTPVEVSIPLSESSPGTLTGDELNERLEAPEWRGLPRSEREAAAAIQASAGEARRFELAPWLALAALLIYFGESIAAGWLDRRDRHERSSGETPGIKSAQEPPKEGIASSRHPKEIQHV